MAWVEKGVAPLQVLCREVIISLVNEEKMMAKLPLPIRLRSQVTERLALTVKVFLSINFAFTHICTDVC